jgi:3-oxoadipate enol-lactonase
MYAEDSGAGVPVLAIHGLGGSAEFFSEFARRVHSEARVLAVDLPGTGRSAGDISMASWVRDLESLVAERTTGPVVILGHSLGTIVALEAWRAWPERVRALILVGGLPRVRPLIQARLTERIAALEGASSLRGWGERVAPGVFSPATIRARPEVVRGFAERFDAQPVESYVRCTRALLDANATGIVDSVTVKTLAIVGTDDQYAPPELVAGFAGRIPGARVEVIQDCGHAPFLERPDEFASLVTGFLRTV